MQLTFKDVEIQEKQAKVKAIAAEVDRRLKACSLAIGRHQFATLIDKSYTYVNEILNTNNEAAQKPYQVAFIPASIIEDPDKFKSEVIDYLCELCGYASPEKLSAMTPEEELAVLKRKIREHGLEPVFANLQGRK